ncbi:EthD domain-containing protein [Rhodopseudomonas palustris]|uniref:EthD domain-containing protein n=1 Tax=Rhodopseudomonas palustris TaxID=1076 RepID=UPI0020CF5620|nr:EthD domain-containing protein [Rhodopseudomonas palustris]MCP9628198.1 EthD domain-containing protein [Rhodopseudomonas palustris]
MLKLTMFSRRLPGLSREQFDQHWRDRHGPLVRSHQAVLRIRRYVQTSPLAEPAAQESLRASRGMIAVDFDGLAELWWDSLEDHAAARTTAEGAAALRQLIEDERSFVDLSRSLAWYGAERQIVP